MKLAKLEAVRGFTAMFVFLGHLPAAKPFGPLNHVWLLTQEMVIVFFVLSGFVIYHSAHRTLSRGFMPYFWRRFVRIYSILLPVLLLTAALQPWRLHEPNFGATLLGNLAMLQDTEWCKPGVIVPTVFRNLPLWSLHYEWWFYMAFFPLATLLPAERQKHVVGLLGVGSAVVYLFAPHFVPRLFMYLTVWWLGVEAARLHLASPAALTLRAMRGPLLYVALTAAPSLVQAALAFARGGPVVLGVHPFLEARHLCAGVAIVLIAFAWRAAGWRGFRWLMAPFALFAPISYSLYIAHFPLVARASHFAGLEPRWLQLGAYTATLFAFCIAAEVWFFPWLRKRLFAASA